MVVNVACQWGLTSSHYEAMTKLYEDWKKQGLEILAVPCNQFNDQESGTNAEIHSFVKDKFKSAFPLLEKIEVNG